MPLPRLLGTPRSIGHVLTTLAACLVVATSSLPAQQVKSLDWTAFSIDARLDSTGTLRVRERQTILFTGDWNGGERRFDVRAGQQFTFRRLLRVDSLTGAEVPMRDGSLDAVDGYRVTNRRIVRWRSRLPSDPPFLNTKITYVLEYEYADILVTEGSAYRLNHEFGFRDRTGTIANFDLTLHVDPAWRTPDGFTGTFRVPVLEPGLGYVVNIPLSWRAAGQPSGVRRSPPLPLRLALAAAVLLVIAGMSARFLRDESAVGRFAPVTPPDRIDRDWLDRHVRSLPAEVVGCLWDEQVGAAEVSATLARLVAEKKLGSRVESTGGRWLGRHVLHLELLVPRKALQGYERSLVDAFFASGATTTSTDDVRKRYQKSGFDPAAIIRQPLEAQCATLADVSDTPRPARRRWPLTLALSVAGIAVLVVAIVTRTSDAIVALLSVALIGMPGFLVARLQAVFWKRRVVRPWRHLLWTLLPLIVALAVFCWALATGYEAVGIAACAGLALLLVAAWRSVLNGSRATMTKARLMRRKELASAREYCRAELQRPVPALDDSWYPYLLAFGLGRHVDKWFRAFGGAQVASSDSGRGGVTSSHTSGSTGASEGGGTFSGFGGGGGFSGAGATVAFGSAVGAMSSGVAAPSSSSGGGGSSSSSGGSSGGGGGGGW